jgi:hypothetical protein
VCNASRYFHFPAGLDSSGGAGYSHESMTAPPAHALLCRHGNPPRQRQKARKASLAPPEDVSQIMSREVERLQ